MKFRPIAKWLTVIVLAVLLWGAYQWRLHTGPVMPLADDKVQLDSPLPGATVSSPLVVQGKARGTWYFEASFPVILKDASGKVITQAPAQAQSDWMTTDWVPFAVTLTFKAQPAGSKGTLILQKDNPSGDPARDESRQITVIFK